MTWLFNFILHNNILKRFIPKQDIDSQISPDNKPVEKEPYFDNVGNMY